MSSNTYKGQLNKWTRRVTEPESWSELLQLGTDLARDCIEAGLYNVHDNDDNDSIPPYYSDGFDTYFEVITSPHA